MQIGSTPIFDAICSQCAALLHGNQHENNALSNKCVAPPHDRDGRELPLNADGTPQANAQPPFLLRYSPSHFALKDSAPAWFAYDKRTNRLSLRAGVQPPWIRATARPGDRNVWFVCLDCKVRYFNDTGRRSHAHIPYRDKASQHWNRPIFRYRCLARAPGSTRHVQPAEQAPVSGEADGGAQDEQGGGEAGEEEGGEEEGEEEEEAEEASEESLCEEAKDNAFKRRGYVPKNINTPPEARPTLEQYQQKWTEKLAWHSRPVPGEFGPDNLVPKPVPDRTSRKF